MPELRFDNRVAVVTGGGRGIGREERCCWRREARSVVVNDWGRTGDGRATLEHVAEEVAAEIRAAGGDAVADTNDVGTSEGATAIVEHALDEWGRIDVLVNNAGAAMVAPSPDALTDTGIEFTIRTHLLATIWTCRRAWPVMVEPGTRPDRQHVVGDDARREELVGLPGASKGGVLGFSRSLAVTGKPLGITVNTIMPMAYTRPMHRYPDTEVREWMAANFPASEIAPLVAYLAHDDVPCTGECFAVGAGRAARIVMMAAPGFQREDGPLTVEDVRDHWDEVMDVSDAVLMRHGRDESAMYRGQAAWSGSNAGYES